MVPIKLIGTIITISAGGSAGKEGPSAQIGAGLASIFADIFKLDDRDRKKLVICGISAGFASVFGTPIAGAIFGIEVLIVGNMFYEALLPSFIAGIVSFQISSKLGISYFYHPLRINYSFNELHFIEAIIAGIFLGLVSIIFIETLNFFEDMSKKLKIWAPVKGLIGGSILVLLTLIFSENFLGLGMDTIESALKGEKIAWYFFLIKIIFTSITLSFGGSGGIITPIFFIGATAGSFLANFLHFDRATLSAIGMINLLASATNTPIASSILSYPFAFAILKTK
ncbi:MAG: chloride channel protein [Dictyoglomus thermophilum]|nr:chloride channel protein [Dictyoglomus thermophilum]MCX7720690.1 chloride channel protein [Dictyoglomus thermophilum]